MSASMTYTDGPDGLRFDWHGGEYIQVYAPGQDIPFDVINVWDYATGQPRIERSLEAFEARCAKWVASYNADEVY